nr:hypothetical protein [Skermania piniformis]
MVTEWAKAPGFAADPQRSAAIRAQTATDRYTYLDAGMTPVRCAGCAATVLVRKHSPQHTSIQWTSDPTGSCAEFADAPGPGLGRSCGRLRASIEHAVLEGMLPVAD